MENTHVTALLPEYLDGVLEDGQEKIVEEHLKDCPLCIKELLTLKKLFKVMEEDVEVPSERMRIRFLEQLDLEKQSLEKTESIGQNPSRKHPWAKDLLKIAASVLLLAGAYFAGKYQSEEKSSGEIASLTKERMEFKQTAVLSLLENESASKRIHGVNLIEASADPDEAIIKALGNRMLYDENTNVRSIAIEALSKFTESESVKSAFLKALEKEKNPSIQIAIIQFLVEIQESKAVVPMKDLLNAEGTQPFIKKEIAQILSRNIL
ncbi:HEAT repeat domain-containing protein [Pricia sp.]|uniref:HEAT repeat domain-containing protein n=1 Tax=Pricia sp. TaxID=2268138 RepID=UPI0035938245